MNEVAKEKKFNSLEKPREVCLVSDPFSIENDMLTPTFKLRRNIGHKKYKKEIDAMYEALAARGDK